MAAANAPTANIAGTWTGSAGTGGVFAPVTMTLAQTGTNVSGTIDVGGGLISPARSRAPSRASS
jgi:hypothetical protein